VAISVLDLKFRGTALARSGTLPPAGIQLNFFWAESLLSGDEGVWHGEGGGKIVAQGKSLKDNEVQELSEAD
jgi:hypothetical protein